MGTLYKNQNIEQLSNITYELERWEHSSQGLIKTADLNWVLGQVRGERGGLISASPKRVPGLHLPKKE